MKWPHILSLSFTCWLAIPGQTQPVIVLSTNWPEALVYADSVLLGPARYHIFRLPAGKRMLRVVPPEGDTWAIPARTVMLPDTTADTLQITVTFRYHYRIESVPSGARIFVRQSERQRFLGETPFWDAFEAPLQDTLYLVRPGYAPVALWPGQQVWNRHRVYLQPLETSVPEVQPGGPTVRRRRWITYAALGVAVAATAVSVHYKFQADRLYARYEETGDPALRPRIRALDLRAGIALGIAQLGLGVAAFRLIFR